MIVKHRIEAAVGDVQAAVGDEEVVDVMHLAVAVGHRGLRVVAHAAGAGLVLAAADAGPARCCQVCTAPASLSHASALAAMKLADLDVVRMALARDAAPRGCPSDPSPRDPTSTRASKTGISCTGPCTRDGALVVPALEILVRLAPAAARRAGAAR